MTEITDLVLKNCSQYINFLYFKEIISWVFGTLIVAGIAVAGWIWFKILAGKIEGDF